MNKILIIQTAFIGDVILATSLIESCKKEFPNAQIDFLLRKGNESLVDINPHINEVYIWNKNQGKFKSLLKLLFEIRKEKYDLVLNIQRFFNSGLLTVFSGAKTKIGFDKNPLSFLFTKKVKHQIPHFTKESFLHEVDRNLQLLSQHIEIKNQGSNSQRPVLYFSQEDDKIIEELNLSSSYIVMAPSSVWFTKQWHLDKWKELIKIVSKSYQVYLIGAPSDQSYTSQLIMNNNCIDLCGKLSLRQSALLMKSATRVFVNDSAPLHLASSVNAKTTAIFCSTVPEFGYGPLSDDHKLIQLEPKLECMPCGLHGKKECPQGHFKCAMDISVEKVVQTI